VRVQRQESGEACFRGAVANLNKAREGGYELRKAAVTPDRVDIDIKGPVNVDAKTLAGGLQIDEKSVKTGADNIVLGLSRSQSDEWCQQVAIKTVENGLGKGYQIRRTESVGPKVGGELVETGIIAVLVTLFGIVIYVWIRFEWQFALGALIALTHDVLTTLGVFAVTQIDFNLASLAAVLTVAGYSINDTVVVFDRVRENLRKYKRMPLVELLNLSINEMLARTIMTSGTTFLAVLALALFGGPVILGFSVAMLWGVIVGTYSSVWIACAILVYTGMRADRLRGVERDKPVNQPTAPVIRSE
jgi:preprotein translocase subunit SecF